MPVLEDLAGIGIRGLLVEETKKGFTLDVATIRAALAGRVCVFGNVDSLELLRHGRAETVEAEVRRQAHGAGPGFVTANGSPVTPGTPVENVRALLRAARALGTAREAGRAAGSAP
jgi:uroporphyrinogen-III decarboxylase